MLKCQQATQLLSEQLERPLSRGEVWSLRLHTSLCKSCRNFGKQMPQLRQILQAYKQQQDDKNKAP